MSIDHSFHNVSIDNMFLRLTFVAESPINIAMASPQGPFYETLGQRLREARRSAKLTQGDLARAVGISRTSITNIETGRQPLYVHVLMRIAEILGTSPTDLMPSRLVISAENDLAPHLKRLKRSQREWVTRVIETPTMTEKTDDAPTVHIGTTTSSRAFDGRTNKKGTPTRRKIGRAS